MNVEDKEKIQSVAIFKAENDNQEKNSNLENQNSVSLSEQTKSTDSLKNQEIITDYISKFLINWNFSRLNTTIQAILITSVAEYFIEGLDTDKAVIINNAVKFAKKFGDGGEKDYKFVNAILDKCLNGKGTSLLLN